jgi:hypothetical protein
MKTALLLAAKIIETLVVLATASLLVTLGSFVLEAKKMHQRDSYTDERATLTKPINWKPCTDVTDKFKAEVEKWNAEHHDGFAIQLPSSAQNTSIRRHRRLEASRADLLRKCPLR